MREAQEITTEVLATSGGLKAEIETVLRETRGRVSGPLGDATRLGVAASTLEYRIRALRIDKYQFHQN